MITKIEILKLTNKNSLFKIFSEKEFNSCIFYDNE